MKVNKYILEAGVFFSLLFLIAGQIPSVTTVVIIQPEPRVSPPIFVEVELGEALVPILKARVTAYSEWDSCHYENCLMANGKPAQQGYVACPRKFSMGTRVQINDQEYVCGDRTAERFDGRFDIFMGYGQDSYVKAINFGVQEMGIRVLP